MMRVADFDAQRLTQWMAVTEETAKSLDEQVMHTRQAVNTAAQQKRGTPLVNCRSLAKLVLSRV